MSANTTNEENLCRESINFYQKEERAMKERPVDKQIRTIDDMDYPCPEEEGMCYYTCPVCTCDVRGHEINYGHLCHQCEMIDWENKFDKNRLWPAKEKVERDWNRLSRITEKLSKERASGTNARKLKERVVAWIKAAKKYRVAKRQLNELEELKSEQLRYMEACYSSASSTA